MEIKKPAIMTKVHIVRVMKVCFFFSYSDNAGSWDFFLNQPGRGGSRGTAHLLRNRRGFFAGAILADAVRLGVPIAHF